MGRSFRFRDYFRGAEENERQGRRTAYVSRAYHSEGDGNFEIAVSYPLHDGAARWIGLLVATLPTGSALGALVLDEPGEEGLTAALLSHRGAERGEDVPSSQPIFILHRGLGRGELLSADIDEVLGADLAGGALVRLVPVRSTPFSVLVRAGVDTPHALAPSPL